MRQIEGVVRAQVNPGKEHLLVVALTGKSQRGGLAGKARAAGYTPSWWVLRRGGSAGPRYEVSGAVVVGPQQGKRWKNKD